MSIPVVQNFIRKTSDKKLTRGLPKIRKSVNECLVELQTYITDVIQEYLGATVYDEKTISDWIFCDDLDSTNAADVENYVKVNLYAARITLNTLIDEIRTRPGGLNYHNIMLYNHLIHDFIHDINGFINFYKRKTEPDFIFLTGGKNYLTSSFETIMIAKALFYNSTHDKNLFPYKESQGMVSMTIRQSIEIKTKRIFGIYKINKVRRRVPDYGFRRIFDFIDANQVDITYNPIDFDILRSIYKWSCGYIHNGDISYLWQTETALRYLNRFFAPAMHVINGRQIRSVFGAFILRNFNTIKQRLEAFVGPDYQIEFLPDSDVEALIESH